MIDRKCCMIIIPLSSRRSCSACLPPSQHAETLLKDLLARTNEVMRHTMGGTIPGSASGAPPPTKKKKTNGMRRKTEKEEDNEVMGDDPDEQENTLPNGAIQLRAQPSIVTGSMRAYQLEGLNWMVRLYHSGVSGILADEM
jgi:hypothetical protein